MEQPEWGKKIAPFFILPQRVIFGIMGFLSIVVGYGMRICFSIAITQMVIAHESKNKSYVLFECAFTEESKRTSTIRTNKGEFDWTEEEQGRALASFYIGYIISHIPGGLLAQKYGGKWVLATGIIISVTCTMLSPFLVRLGGLAALICIRICVGLGQGVIFPTLSNLLSAWIPLRERGKMGALVLGGGQIGSVFSNSVSGILLNEFKWDFTFYFYGLVGLIWVCIFITLCYNTPGSHPFIKETEKQYLLEELGYIEKKELPPVPWKLILTNAAMLALICAQIGHDWGFYIMVSYLPKYLDDVLHFSIQENGFYSSMPYLAMWICTLCFGTVADYTITRNYISITNSRKFFTTLGAVGPGVFLLAASYSGCNKFLVVLYFTVAMGLMGAFYSGMKLSPLDMSPNYAGPLMAITNGIGAITGVVAPYSTGVLTPNANLFEWRLVFWMAFWIFAITSAIYCIWASGEIQPFNDYKPDDKKDGS